MKSVIISQIYELDTKIKVYGENCTEANDLNWTFFLRSSSCSFALWCCLASDAWMDEGCVNLDLI